MSALVKSQKILLIEDEQDIRELMALQLKRLGHDVVQVGTAEEGLHELCDGDFGLAIVDWMLPVGSGIDLTRKIRGEIQLKNLPVLMVTAKSEPEDIVAGLEAGADDYVTKPFEIPVFLARVAALLRRLNVPTGDHVIYRIGNLSLNTESYDVKVDGEGVSLTPSEFKLLLALVKNQGKVMTRERLIDLVQGEGVVVVDRAVDTHVFGLRKKLGSAGDLVETVRGVGYRVRSE